jgi:hypothetical protein
MSLLFLAPVGCQESARKTAAKEVFEMKIRCAELKTKWEKRFEDKPDIIFDRPGFTKLGEVCYSPKYNTCLGETVSFFSCGPADKGCDTEYSMWDLISGNRLTDYCWFIPGGQGSCLGVYSDTDSKKPEKTKALEYVIQVQATMGTLKESCSK